MNPDACMHVVGRGLSCRTEGELVIDLMVQPAHQNPACHLLYTLSLLTPASVLSLYLWSGISQLAFVVPPT